MDPLGTEPNTDRPARADLGGTPMWLYPPTSRYVDTPVVPDGEVRRLARRLVPPVDPDTPARYRVVAGDRLDLLAATHLGGALLWWRIADRNLGDDPADLVAEPRRALQLGIDTTGAAISGVILGDGQGVNNG